MEKLPSLQDVVHTYGLLKNKNFSKAHGQNFLFDMNITRKICTIVKTLENNIVIEVGPGPGGLTRAILEKNPKHLYAIEIDPNCVKAQVELTTRYDNFSVIEADALTVDIGALMIQHPGHKLHIIANLPYNVGTELLIRWLHLGDLVSSMTLMFQKEVADRILANPNTKDYGRLSILAQYVAETHRFFNLPPTAFTPAPKVESTVIHVIPRHLSDEDKAIIPYIERLAKAAFNQRRKMLRSSLSSVFSKEQMEEINLDFTKRAEDLTIEDFVMLAKTAKVLG